MKPRTCVFFHLACFIHVHAFLENKTQNHRCLEEMDPGPCQASVPSWYFDVISGFCKEFIYGGCQGNGNRFTSMHECKAVCSGFMGMKNTTTPCMKKPDPGFCRAYIVRWFYDTHDHVCKTFIYGGCQGNSNNFATEKKCQVSCMPTSSDQGTCSLDPKQVSCNARAQLWYFDHGENTCRRFPPGFCGSSANKFATCHKCMRRCSSADAHKACSVAYKKIHYRKYGITWPGETEPRVRGPSEIMKGLDDVKKPALGAPAQVGPMLQGTGLGSSTLNPAVTEIGSTIGGNILPPVSAPGLTGPSSNSNGLGRPFSGGPGIRGPITTGPASVGNALEETTLGGSPLSRPTTGTGTISSPGLGTTMLGTTPGGHNPEAPLERGSNLKTPPLTIPPGLLKGFRGAPLRRT